MIFECKPIELYKRDGSISGFGVEWTEARTLTENSCQVFGKGLLTVAILLAGATVIGGLVGGSNAAVPLGVAAAVCFGLGAQNIRSAVNMPGKKQFIEFLKDGQVVTSRDGIWKTTVAEIGSIEAEQVRQKKSEDELPYTHGVRIITRRGRVVHVAKDIEPDDAITLAVMMSEAIEAVRYADQIKARVKPNGIAAEVW